MDGDEKNFRIISRDLPDRRRIIAAVIDSDDPNRKSDEEILDAIQADMDKHQLRAVKDPE